MVAPTNEKDNTKLQGENHNQAFSSGRIVSQATVEFALQTSSGLTDEVLISLCYGLLIHRKRSPFPHKGRLFVTLRFILGPVVLLRFAQRKVCFANV